MQQHLIPQDISGFEFKLVGALTLKQFLYLAGFGILSFIIFVSIGSFLKWVFIVPLASLGLAFAFFPINGMKFDKWIVIFIRAITSPSKRVWRKEPKIFSFLEPQFAYYLRRPSPRVVEKTADRSQLEAFVAQIKSSKQKNKLDSMEKTRLGMLGFDDIKWGQTPGSPKSLEVITAVQKTEEEPKAEEVKSSFFGLAHAKKEVA